MNGITINNKQYIFLETSEDVGCDKCDFYKDEMCKAECVCISFAYLLNRRDGSGILKELKEEK